MNRRKFLEFIVASLAAAGLLKTAKKGQSEPLTDQIMTVNGPIDPGQLGIALPHEHVMSTFGAPPSETARYDVEKLYEKVIPYLKKLKIMGCDSIMDCTAAYFGRAPKLLQHISIKSRIHILTNTGYYGAADDRYVPEHAHTESAEQIAQRWIKEWKDGIDHTGIRPGFIKIGVDSGPLSEIDKKIVHAAALTHLKTGLVIAAHTSDNPKAAMQQLDILKSNNVHPSAWIWVHAQNVTNTNAVLDAAKQGAWIEFDGLKPESIEEHLHWIQTLKSDYFNQILLSHDGNSFRANDRPPKPYDALFTHFITALREHDFSQKEIDRLIRLNPANAFTVRIRTI